MSDFTEIKKGLKKYDVLSGDDAFIQTMKEFQIEAQKKFDTIEHLQKKSESSYESAVTFYGEDANKMQPNEFFKIFHTFLASWQVRNEILLFNGALLTKYICIYIEMLR
jgi:hypothetical protein